MHLLLAQKGSISDGDEAIDLGQTPGDVLFLSAADTELAAIAAAVEARGEQSVRWRLASACRPRWMPPSPPTATR